MTGILLVDKPVGFTSFDVVAKLRGMAHERHVGHAGTLDPMATGVLPVFFGKATKASGALPCSDKRYMARLRLGTSTDTQDSTGTVLCSRPVTAGAADVRQALQAFRGEILQTPPMYSAVQVDGTRLYKLARAGKTVERPARRITVSALVLKEADEAAHEYTLEIACSQGTYVRSICNDLGEALGCGAMMIELRRTQACGWDIAQCATLEAVQRAVDEGRFPALLLPVESAFSALPCVTLDARLAWLFCNGVRLSLSGNAITTPPGRYTVYGPAHAFLGVAHSSFEDDWMQMDQFFAEKGNAV